MREAATGRSVPGIEIVEDPAGARARVSGSGLDVSEVIQAYRSCGKDLARLAAAFDWLTSAQIDAAFRYYALYPQEIEARLAGDARLSPAAIKARYSRLAADELARGR